MILMNHTSITGMMMFGIALNLIVDFCFKKPYKRTEDEQKDR